MTTQSKTPVVLTIVLVLFIAASVVFGALYLQQRQQAKPTETVVADELSKQDSDSDGLTDAEEKNLKTNPYSADTDRDGVKDGTEVTQKSDPLVADSATTNQPSDTTTAVTDDNCTTNAIVVTTPVENQVFTSPGTVSGKATAFEGTVNWRILDGQGTQLATGYVTTSNGMECSPFSDTLTFPLASTTTGTIEFYTVSAKDGSEENKVAVKIKF